MSLNNGPPEELLLFWAKRPRDSTSPLPYHPLLCHMIDVAVVADRIWHDLLGSGDRRGITAALGLDAEEDAGRWVAFWAGLHDIGKASPAFQLKDRTGLGRLQRAGLHCPTPPLEGRHGTITAFVLPSILHQEFGLSGGLSSRVASVAGGHHGAFPGSEEVNRLAPLAAVGKGTWEVARLKLAQRLAHALGLPPKTPTSTLDNATAMALAGLVSVADWIGSDEKHFPYAVQDREPPLDIDLASYARKAAEQARKALHQLGWDLKAAPAERLSFGTLFPRCDPPHPVQREAVSLAQQLDGPSLVVIEAPTGEGKTEAAIYLADHAGTSLGERGCYFALPTQATSNQMFGRVRDFLARRYADGTVQLQLLHGHAALSAEFELLKKNADHLFEPNAVYGEGENVVAAEWFTHRKRGLLAPFGVGTVDQALLAVLQTRHVFVRLFGLAHKTVIFDEVHAYDTYMSALLERLLEWLGALGSSVVVLSATLPMARRDRLVNAYARGLGRKETTLPVATYPRLSWVSLKAQGATHVETSTQSTKEVRLGWVDGQLPESGGAFELGKRLGAALANGGCAAVICNTVGRAQQVYCALKRYFPGQADDGQPELDLLHARYLFKDRQTRQKRSEVRFGKPDGEVTLSDGTKTPVHRPRRAVLVATQVIEQSLDLDFDLMVTDLAPADLVLQRAGRLHRHQRARPSGLEEPCLWLCRPEEADGVPRFDKGTEAVYALHILLRSWLELKDRAVVHVPGDVEDIIEAVYDDDRPCPEGLSEAVKALWQETQQALAKEMERDAKEAEKRWLKAPDYSGALWRLTAEELEEDAPEFHKAHQALTRLSEPTVPVVFLHGTPERPCLEADGLQAVNLSSIPTVVQAKELLMRSVPVSDRRVIGFLLDQEVPPGWRQSALLRHHRLAVAGPTGAAPVGKYRLQLDSEVGLAVIAEAD
ncbi:MAG: CRISPR-associated helicase Cas3' [Chloroflexi bacterium]|nr:CRISPR-associated helicase Cas3' [Chloroflexota bacterium]